MDKAKRRYQRTGRKQRVFTRFDYQAKSWPAPRTVIAKAEYHAGGANHLGHLAEHDGQRLFDAHAVAGDFESAVVDDMPRRVLRPRHHDPVRQVLAEVNTGGQQLRSLGHDAAWHVDRASRA